MRLRAMTLLLLLSMLFCVSAQADPLILAEDLSGETAFPLGEDSEVQYLYSYAYPQVLESDPSAGLINQFYAYLVSDALDFEIPMMVDFYTAQQPQEDIFVRISYEVTCNREDYFSILLKTEGNDYLTYTGHTFSRLDLKPGSSVALPYLLGILATDESDTWLQERQTAKADDLVRSLVWTELQSRRETLGVYEDLDRELFDLVFYPEEDFYLDETGNPVFYLEPGSAADPASGLLRFPINLWDILDEM